MIVEERKLKVYLEESIPHMHDNIIFLLFLLFYFLLCLLFLMQKLIKCVKNSRSQAYSK